MSLDSSIHTFIRTQIGHFSDYCNGKIDQIYELVIDDEGACEKTGLIFRRILSTFSLDPDLFSVESTDFSSLAAFHDVEEITKEVLAIMQGTSEELPFPKFLYDGANRPYHLLSAEERRALQKGVYLAVSKKIQTTASELFNPIPSVLAEVTEDPTYLYKHPRFHKNPEILFQAFIKDPRVLSLCPRELLEDGALAHQCLGIHPDSFFMFCERLQQDPGLILELLSKNPLAFSRLSDHDRSVKDYAMRAVSQEGLLLEYVDKSLLEDGELIDAALTQNIKAFAFVAGRMKSDREFVRRILQIEGACLAFCSEDIRADFELAQIAIRQNGLAIEFAHRDLKNSTYLATLAVSSNPESLQFLSKRLKNNKRVVARAVSLNGFALKFASRNLRNNGTIASLAVSQNGFALRFASPRLKKSAYIVLAAIDNTRYAYELADLSLKDDPFIKASAGYL